MTDKIKKEVMDWFKEKADHKGAPLGDQLEYSDIENGVDLTIQKTVKTIDDIIFEKLNTKLTDIQDNEWRGYHMISALRKEIKEKMGIV